MGVNRIENAAICEPEREWEFDARLTFFTFFLGMAYLKKKAGWSERTNQVQVPCSFSFAITRSGTKRSPVGPRVRNQGEDNACAS